MSLARIEAQGIIVPRSYKDRIQAYSPFQRIIASSNASVSRSEFSPLYQICQPVKITESGLTQANIIAQMMITELIRYREQTGGGLALAANQLGFTTRIAIMIGKDGNIEIMLNPEVLEEIDQRAIYHERCISGTPLGVNVIRAAQIKAGWYGLNGIYRQKWLNLRETRTLLHEIQHHDGEDCYSGKGADPASIGLVDLIPEITLL